MSPVQLTPEEIKALREGMEFPLDVDGSLRLELHCVTHAPVVTFRGQILGPQARAALERIEELLGRIPGPLIADLGAAEYLPSETLGFLSRFAFSRQESGQRVFLCGIPKGVRLSVSYLGLDEIFHERASVEEAISEGMIDSTGLLDASA
jgi:anti-anti-sigma factor